jgi:hypothetical protein
VKRHASVAKDLRGAGFQVLFLSPGELLNDINLLNPARNPLGKLNGANRTLMGSMGFVDCRKEAL